MSRWIDIDDISLLKTVSVGGLSAKALWRRIRQQPSIDIVRCKECKYGDAGNDEDGNLFWKCIGIHYGGTEPDDFCSYGERKESE